MHDPGLLLLTLAYRSVYTVAGGYITAKLAPHAPMRHVLVLAIIGLVLGTAGAIVGIRMQMSPAWYPISLAASAVPLTWLGGVLHGRKHTG